MSEKRNIQIVKKVNGVRHVRNVGVGECNHEWDVPPASDVKNEKQMYVCPTCGAKDDL